jgi:hypothetical protein
MLFDNEDHKSKVGRRRAFERMICTSSGVLSACVRIPTKPAMHSKLKPATRSDLKPATVPI